MTLGLFFRSILALALCAAIAALALAHAAIPEKSAIYNALNGTSNGPLFNAAGQRGVVIQPGQAIYMFNNVPGHIFYVDPSHNLSFITGQHPRRQFTGDSSSVAPALSPDGTNLAWVNLQRNYSDIYVTKLKYAANGAISALSTQQMTQDQVPPPALQRVAAPPIYDVRYWWFATKPAWFSNGQGLAYVSDRPGFDPSDPETVAGAIWEQGLTDTITNAIQLSSPIAGTGGHDSPAWRPTDGATFLYTNYYSGLDLPSGEGIIEAGQAPSNTVPGVIPTIPVVNLTPHGTTAEFPAWSPDGQSIAFIEDTHQQSTSLRIMPFHAPGSLADYSSAITVTVDASYVTQPFWSPNGRYIGYLTSNGGDFSLTIRPVIHKGINLHFGAPIALQQAGAISADYRPTWGP